VTEALRKDLIDPSGRVRAAASRGTEPGGRPVASGRAPQATAQIVEHRRDPLFRQVVEEPSQLLAVRAYQVRIRRGGCRYPEPITILSDRLERLPRLGRGCTEA
jgi:hypothetical protein